jgi:cytosine/uracil/thiamine/allantoin permease
VKVNVLKAESIPPVLTRLYDYAWFVGFAIAFLVYLALRTLSVAAKKDPSLPLPATST